MYAERTYFALDLQLFLNQQQCALIPSASSLPAGCSRSVPRRRREVMNRGVPDEAPGGPRRPGRPKPDVP